MTPQSKFIAKSDFGATSPMYFNVKLEIADQKYRHRKERSQRENKTVLQPVNHGAKLGNMQVKDF